MPNTENGTVPPRRVEYAKRGHVEMARMRSELAAATDRCERETTILQRVNRTARTSIALAAIHEPMMRTARRCQSRRR